MQLNRSSSWKEREWQRNNPPEELIEDMRKLMAGTRQMYHSLPVPNHIFVGKWTVLGWRAGEDGLDTKLLSKQAWFRNLSRTGKMKVARQAEAFIKEKTRARVKREDNLLEGTAP